jgi:3,4-dihydroxy 2-butanone 4-phosphate synthase/GTP cyclohydrolase II
VAIDPSCGPQDIVTPGHVFPLVARDGGTLERTGHTEAAVDLARLAGLTPAGVICEIMNDDGTMARRNDLITFAQRHGLKIGTIADLIAYRRRYDSIVKRISETKLDSIYGGDFRCVVYVNKVTMAQHVALVKGDPAAGGRSRCACTPSTSSPTRWASAAAAAAARSRRRCATSPRRAAASSC